jgi:hypothetical protein
MLRSSRLLAACAFLVGILLGASVCGADGPSGRRAVAVQAVLSADDPGP